MARSRKLPILKDRGIYHHKYYHRKIKRRIRQAVKGIRMLADKEAWELPAPQALVNDYDYCDYFIDFRCLRPFWKRLSDEHEMTVDRDKASRK